MFGEKYHRGGLYMDVITLALARKLAGSGSPGKDGDDGKSAYEIAVENGFQGTEEQWLESLKGIGIPSGGKTGQILAKGSDDDYQATWMDEYENLDTHSFDGLNTDDKTLVGAVNELLSALAIKEF